MGELSNRLFRIANQGHVRWYVRSKGRRGSMKGRVVILTTTGRRSGVRRSVPVFHVRDGDKYVVTATAGGAPAHPAWYLNLVADPDVELQDRDRVAPMRARPTEGAERQRYWDQIVARDPRFARYESRTDRVIPVVVLEPR